MKQVARIASGYVYYVSLKGVTGAGNLDIDSVVQNLERLRKTHSNIEFLMQVQKTTPTTGNGRDGD